MAIKFSFARGSQTFDTIMALSIYLEASKVGIVSTYIS